MRTPYPVLLAAAAAFTSTSAFAQPPCLSSFATPAGQTAVANGSWNPPVVPSTTCVALNVTTTAGSTNATVTGCNAVLNGALVSGPNFPAGTTVVSTPCTSVTFSQPATVTGSTFHTFTLPAYGNTYPPQNTGIPGGVNCCVCPATFSVNMCAGQYFTYQMCPGHAYTISMCNAATTWDSYLAVTTTAGTVLATGSATSDDDGCGTTDGHASLTFVPTATGTNRVRLWQDPCTVSGAACGLITVTCNLVPIGMDERSVEDLPLSIQPNPASDLLQVSSSLKGFVDFLITDLSGRMVLRQNGGRAERTTIDIGQLAPGTYVIIATDANRRKGSALFVKE